MKNRGENRLNIFFMAAIMVATGIVLLVGGCSQEKAISTLPSIHPPAWMEPESPDFHGNVIYARGLESCAQCHGADFNGGQVGVSCLECHIQNGGCRACHGGKDNNTGAPPYGLRGEADDTSLAVGAHTIHMDGGSMMAASIPCLTCHHVPTVALDSAHLDLASPVPDSIAEIVWGGLEAGGEAVWNRQTRQCTNTYCHGNFAGGDTLNTPVWTGSDQALCGSCHDVGDDPARLLWKHAFHVQIAGLGCYQCHNGMIDNQGDLLSSGLHVNGQIDFQVANQAVCDACHDPGANMCAACHGGYDNQTGAPPYGLRGEIATTSLAVGAHISHLEGSSLAAGIECNTCHLVPENVIDTAHFDLGQPTRDSIAEITWSGLGANGQTVWDRNTAECSGSYCHGNFLGGNDASPIWTGTDQAECGSCHDVAGDSLTIGLLGSHKFHVGTADIKCSNCHGTVVDDNLNIISNTLHVNGDVETAYLNPALCDACHGFATSCIVCHGGQDNTTGAPPVGLDGETATSELAVGAHTKHLGGGAISDGVPCTECHIRPSHPLDAGHLDSDGIPDIDFGTLAGASSTWNRNPRTCTGTYCHGNFSGGYTGNSPIWTSGSGQAACGSCHPATSGYSSMSGRHQKHIVEEGIACYQCHSTTVDTGLAVIGKAIHINGVNNVSFSSGQGNYIAGQCTNVGCHSAESWFGGGDVQGRSGRRP